MTQDKTDEWLSLIERVMLINLKGRRDEDMDELMMILARLEALQADSANGAKTRSS